MTEPSVFAYYLTNGQEVSHSFMSSVYGVMSHRPNRMLDGGPYRRVTRTMELPDARNEMTRAFLASGADWMWSVDTDMGFAPDTLERLIESAEIVGAGAIGALCFMWSPTMPDGMGGYRGIPVPTLHEWDGQGFGMWSLAESGYPTDQVIRVGATGAACLLIHRETCLAIEREFGDEWWSPVRYTDGRTLGEDLSFFYRMIQVNIPAFVDTSIKTTHAKTMWIGEQDYFLYRGTQ